MYLPEYYEFGCRTRIVSGDDALSALPGLLHGLHAERPLIVTDAGVMAAGLHSHVVDALSERITVGAVEGDVPPDSDLVTVSRLARAYAANGCDSLIAVGGGSVIDTAKGVNVLVSENGRDLSAFAGTGTLKRRLKPLIAVPTTSGTGSECTPVAVVTDHSKGEKKLLISRFLEPDAAVLDPRMTLSLPPAVTAATAMDAMAHAVEAYTCLAKNPVSDACAFQAVALISRYLLPVMEQPHQREGRLALAHAATLAGMAFSNSMVGMVHTLGHAVGARCQLPHGVCMAVLLPYGLEYNMHRTERFAGELLLPLAGPDVYARTPKHLRGEGTVENIRKLNRRLQTATQGAHPCAFKDLADGSGLQRVSRDRLPELARFALNDPSIVYNPEALEYDDCLAVLEYAWSGDPLPTSMRGKG